MPAISSINPVINLTSNFTNPSVGNVFLPITNISNSQTHLIRVERVDKQQEQEEAHHLAYSAHVPKVRHSCSFNHIHKLSESEKKSMSLEKRKEIRASARQYCKIVEEGYENLQSFGRKAKHQIDEVQREKEFCQTIRKLSKKRVTSENTSTSSLEKKHNDGSRGRVSFKQVHHGSDTPFVIKKEIKSKGNKHCRNFYKNQRCLKKLGPKGEHQLQKVQRDKDFCDQLKKSRHIHTTISPSKQTSTLSTASSTLSKNQKPNTFRDPCDRRYAYSGSVNDFLMKILTCVFNHH